MFSILFFCIYNYVTKKNYIYVVESFGSFNYLEFTINMEEDSMLANKYTY